MKKVDADYIGEFTSSTMYKKLLLLLLLLLGFLSKMLVYLEDMQNNVILFFSKSIPSKVLDHA